VANAGHPQVQRDGLVEKPLITCGDDLVEIARFIPEGQTSYSAADVITKVLGLDA